MTDTRRSLRSSKHPAIARHGRLRKSSPYLLVLKFLAAATAVLLVSAASVATIALLNLGNNITSVALVSETDGPPPPLGSYEGGFNVLIVGSDVCEDHSGCNGRGTSELNDVTLLLHVSQDQTNAVAVSIPRDMVVPIPACPRADGKGNNHSMSAQPINVTLFYGGLPCTVLTVEALTGLTIPFAAEVKFSGVVQISTAVGGVPVCIDGPIRDRYSGFSVPAAGEYTLSGADALSFLRTRHGVGDGSDLGRISSQQMFLSSMVRILKQPGGTLSDPVKLFNVATVVSRNTILSNSLKNPVTMVAMAQVLKNLQLDKVMFVQYPGVTGQDGVYLGKVAPVKATAAALFAKIRADEPFVLKAGATGVGTKVDPNAPAVVAPLPSGSPSAAVVPAAAAPPATATQAAPEVLPGIEGQSAAENTCARHN